MTHVPSVHPPAPPADPRRWWILGALALAQAILVIDVTVLNVALPSIGAGLGLDRAALTWVVTAYTLFFGSLLLLGGRLADALGRRRTFLAGLATFTAASLGSALAPDGTILVIARMAQGVGAALLSPAALSIVGTTFAGPERARALGVWAAVGASGAAVGVVVGGLLTATFGWQAIFLINVPIGLAVALAIRRLLRADEARPSAVGIDVPGAIVATVAVGLLLFGLITAGDGGWASPSAIAPIVAAGVAGLFFVVVERGSPQPLVRLRLLGQRSVASALGLMLVASGMLASSFFLASLYLQRTLGLDALEAGLAFVPGAIAILLGAQAGANALARVGSRAIGSGGLLVGAAGAVMLAGLPLGGDVVLDVVPGLIVMSLGLGAAFVTATTTMFSRLDHRDAGAASGLVNTAHELGFAVGVAVVSTIAAASLAAPATSVGGFGAAYALSAVVGALGAVLALVTLPSERAASGRPAFAH